MYEQPIKENFTENISNKYLIVTAYETNSQKKFRYNYTHESI